ncbi:MAG: hypothetical protein KF819_30015 [Labilithrix sp.]|nr:hypothetical protein [Labilithrix sp.]
MVDCRALNRFLDPAAASRCRRSGSKLRDRHVHVADLDAELTGHTTSQIVIATMFLRWHYLVDILAGFALAVSGLLGARALAPAEARSRAAFGCSPVWESLWP